MKRPDWLSSPPETVETIASGRGIRELARLKRVYGGRNWRKKKGYALVLIAGSQFRAEIHWYEAHGVGAVEYKIKSLP